MKANQLPKMNMDTSATGCCPKFDPKPWDGQTFVFEDKLFAKAKTVNFWHVPLNMGKVMTKAWQKIEKAKAADSDGYLTLSYDPSPFIGEHYFAVSKEVPGLKMVKLSGTYLSKVFEGPYGDAKLWVSEMKKYVKSKDKEMKKLYFFYTTCPKCIKTYGKNYVVAFAEI